MVNNRLVAVAGSSNGQKRKAPSNEETNSLAKEAKIDENKSIKICIEVTKRFVFDVKEKDSIASIMGKIPEEGRITVGNLKAERLFHGEKKLLNHLSLSDYKIQEDTTLALKQIMTISVIDTDFEETTLQVADSDTVQSILDKVTKDRESLEGLLYNEQRIDPNRPLWNYGIEDGDFLRICRKGNHEVKFVSQYDSSEYVTDEEVEISSNGNNGAAKTRQQANQTITINVEDSDGSRFCLRVKRSYAIEAVMAKIGQERGIPTENKRLYYNEKKLENGRTLWNYDILSDSTIFMRNAIMIRVLVENLDPVELEVEPYTTFKNIKKRLPNRRLFSLVPPPRILFDGRRCNDDHTIAGVEIEDGDQIEIYPNPFDL